MDSTASTPRSLAPLVRWIASWVALLPAPAMTFALLTCVDDDLDDPQVLLVVKGRRLAGGAAGHDGIDALPLLELHQFPQAFLVELPVRHGKG